LFNFYRIGNKKQRPHLRIPKLSYSKIRIQTAMYATKQPPICVLGTVLLPLVGATLLGEWAKSLYATLVLLQQFSLIALKHL
jgi:hypothetical protein